MAEMQTASLWRGRVGYLLAAFLLILVQLLPLETLPPSLFATELVETTQSATETLGIEAIAPAEPEPQRRMIGPDLLLLLTFAFMVRRPDLLPVIGIGLLFLLTDLMFHRPPGLWAALVVMLSEFLRYRSRGLRVLPFPFEWATIGIGLILITLVNRFTLAFMLVPQAPLGLTLVQTAITILCYPLVVLAAYLLMGVKRPAQGEVDAMGNRL